MATSKATGACVQEVHSVRRSTAQQYLRRAVLSPMNFKFSQACSYTRLTFQQARLYCNRYAAVLSIMENN